VRSGELWHRSLPYPPLETHVGVLIIGTGLAGYTVAREVRKHDDAIGITLVTADDGHNYSKPMLSNGFAKGKSADGLRQQSAEQMAEALGVTVRTHTRVTGIDTAAKRVRTDTDTLDYDQLVLAVGAKQLVLPLDGDAADDVMRVNTLGEYAHFRNQIEGASRVAIMGPGLIGCEFANDLANGGFQCDVIGPDNHPLERLMPEPAGRALQGALAALGVQSPTARRFRPTRCCLLSAWCRTLNWRVRQGSRPRAAFASTASSQPVQTGSTPSAIAWRSTAWSCLM